MKKETPMYIKLHTKAIIPRIFNASNLFIILFCIICMGCGGGSTNSNPANTVEPSTGTIDDSWDAMMQLGTRSEQNIHNWYNQYTGYDGDAYVINGHADDLGRNLTETDLTPSSGFTTTADGQIIERLDVSGTINVLHDNVTIRGCRITTTLTGDGVSAFAGADNLTVEYCSFYSPVSGSGVNRAVQILSSGGAVVRFNWLNEGFNSGLRHQGEDSGLASLWEYNYVPQIRRYTGSHNTSITFCAARGGLKTLRRNFLNDGTSAAISIYPQLWCGGAVNGLNIEENIIGICCDDRWYFINSGGDSPETMTNVQFHGNIFIPGLNPLGNPRTPFGDDRGPFTEFTTFTGNVWASTNQYLDGTHADIAGASLPDMDAPTVPTGLAASNVTGSTVALDWNASTDNDAVTGYNIYMDGSNPMSTSGTSIVVTNLSPLTSYTFTVSAYDAAGNESAQSSGVNVTTEDTLTWEQAWVTRDQATIDQWYADNTGYTAYYDPSLGRTLTLADLTPSDGITTTSDGQIIEKMHITGGIKVRHDNVIIRGCLVEPGLYGIHSLGGDDNVNISYTTCSAVEHEHKGIFINGTGTISHCLVTGHSSGLRVEGASAGGSTWEYCWVPDIYVSPGSHNTSMTVRNASDVVIRRCNFNDGTSAALSLYTNDNDVVNILIEENLLNVRSTTNYCTNGGDGSLHSSYYTRYINNIFGQRSWSTCGSSGPIASFDRNKEGNEFTGNTYMDGSTLP